MNTPPKNIMKQLRRITAFQSRCVNFQLHFNANFSIIYIQGNNKTEPIHDAD